MFNTHSRIPVSGGNGNDIVTQGEGLWNCVEITRGAHVRWETVGPHSYGRHSNVTESSKITHTDPQLEKLRKTHIEIDH